jgi:glycosyltransferase involved in cell wall biosynthesis
MFSIIIPNYNHARFLKKRIDSVLQQTFTDFEVIILDDCSTDDSIEILDSYKDHRITHRIYNSENSQSPFSQWKKGLQLAKYDYIWIAESDDFCSPELLSSAYKVLNHDKEISLYYCDSNLMGENEEPFYNTVQKYTHELDSALWDHDHQINGKTYVRKYLSKKNFILNASSVIFRRDYGLDAVDAIQDFKTSGDWFFYAQILLQGDVYFHAVKQNYFRHSSQSTRNYNTLEKRERRILEKVKVNEFFIRHFNYSETERQLVVTGLIDEWIRYHFLKEIFSFSFFKISKLSILKISEVQLLKKAILAKIKNRLSIK